MRAEDHSCCSITEAGADSSGKLKWDLGPWAGGEALGRHWRQPHLWAPSGQHHLPSETCVSGLALASQVPPWEQPRLPAGVHSPAGGWWQHEEGLQLWHSAEVVPRGKAEVQTAAHSRNNHEFGVSCAVTHCKLCAYPQNQDCCHSLFLILGCCPFPTRCAHSPCWQMHSTGLLFVCRLTTAGAQRRGYLFQGLETERGTSYMQYSFILGASGIRQRPWATWPKVS